MSKIIPSISDSAVNLLQNFYSLLKSGSAFLFFTQTAICFCQSLFVSPKKSRIRNLFAVGKRGVMLESRVNSNRILHILDDWLVFCFRRKYHIPAVRLPLNRASFNLPFNRAVQFYFKVSDFGKLELITLKQKTALGIAKRIESIFRFKTWKTCFFAIPNTAKKLSKVFDTRRKTS